MYFKKLEVFGFKSFADKTVLNFEPGVTAIVGPNGCGKSNVFDAIRWVLGEQSMKELRGSSREDIIFNGTGKRPALGMAEVSLTFSNESNALPIEGKEVTITRRQYRSGESEYLLNKQIARLKDITQLLMGTGIGAEAYSMIQQGKVDLVVSAKPEERRMILDEASGITRYKAKKKEAMSKLKDTENNLLRVNDIIVEVKRQIGSIERQANKARKYKGEFEKLKRAELTLAKFELGSFGFRKKDLEEKLQTYSAKEQELDREIEEISETLTNEINYLSELEQKINDIRQEDIKLQGQIDVDQGQIGFNQERIRNAEQNDGKLREQKAQLSERINLQRVKIEDVRRGMEGLEELIAGKEEKLAEYRETLIKIEEAIEQAKARIKENEEKIFALTSKQVSLRNELTDCMKDIQGALARKRRLELENEKVNSEKQQVDEKLGALAGQMSSLREIMDDLMTKKNQKAQDVDGIKEEITKTQGAIDDLERRRLFLKSQKEFIEKMHVQYQDMPDPVVEGKFLTKTPPLDHHTGIIGKVKEVRVVEEAAEEKPKPSLFGFRFSQPPMKKLYEIICETKFIELDPQQISLKIEEISEEITRLSVTKENAEARFQEERALLIKMHEEFQGKEKELSVLESQKKDVEEEINKLIGEMELVDSEVIEVRQTLEDSKKREEVLNYQLDTVNQDVVYSQNSIKDQQAEIDQRLQDREEATIAIAQLETEIQSQREKFDAQKETVAMFEEDMKSWQQEIERITAELEQLVINKEDWKKEIETLHQRIEDIRQSQEALKNDLSELEMQREDLGQKINSRRESMRSLEDELEEVRQNRHSQQMQEQELAFKEQSIKDRLVQSYKISFDEALERAKEQQQEFERIETYKDKVCPLWEDFPQFHSNGKKTKEAKPSTEEILQALPHQEEPEEEQLQEGDLRFLLEEYNGSSEELEVDIEKLKKRCESYGSVNLVAIEEFEALKERFEFLTKQQSDLLEAKSQLMSTISKINRSTKQMFMDTFTKVGEEFRIYFRMLFGGGEAQLVLLDPDNVLESGIDIVARPPGKKLQSISLMSGGEKTLTAIALVFGVFKVNPSPFCVLDEIDAALDESNVGRFSYLLREFSKIAQFIVITHNKKTMSTSDVMYGVTMPETGVSRIVSVKFSEQEETSTQEVAASV